MENSSDILPPAFASIFITSQLTRPDAMERIPEKTFHGKSSVYSINILRKMSRCERCIEAWVLIERTRVHLGKVDFIENKYNSDLL